MSPPPDAGGPSAEVDGRTVRWRMRVAYDGTGFHGFAAQDGQQTVAGAIVDALERITGERVLLTCAGRTDTGVHALDQVVHFDLPEPIAAALDPSSVVKSCNSQLGSAVVVSEARPALAGFDARRSALARRYRYLVLNSPVADPLLAGRSWHVTDELDLRLLRAAADSLLGEHDFRAFCRRAPGTGADDPIPRRVLDACWYRVGPGGPRGTREPREPRGDAPSALLPAFGELYAFEIEANAFCHQMVRSLVGTLVDVGRGRKRPSDIPWILRAADRRHASQPAPAFGLTLIAVRYPE